MEMVITKAEFSEALSRVQGIVEKKNTVPILSCVLLEARGEDLTVSATDLEIFLRATYRGKVAREGAVAAPAKKLFEIVRELPEGELRVSADDKGGLRIEMGRAKFKVNTLAREDFPATPADQVGETLEMPTKVLGEAMDKTGFAMSHDIARQALNGILLEVSPAGGEEAEVRLVATDGHRLAYIRRRCPGTVSGDRGVIVPRKAVTELRRMLSDDEGGKVELSFQENRLVFRMGAGILVTRLVDGQFPDYRQVIPSGGVRVAVVEREPFYRAVRRVATLSADRVNLVRFSYLADRVSVTALNPEIGEATEDVEIEYQGSEIEVGMNARYVLDACAALEQERLTLEMNEALSPVLMRPVGDEGYRCVIMPMRV